MPAPSMTRWSLRSVKISRSLLGRVRLVRVRRQRCRRACVVVPAAVSSRIFVIGHGHVRPAELPLRELFVVHHGQASHPRSPDTQQPESRSDHQRLHRPRIARSRLYAPPPVHRDALERGLFRLRRAMTVVRWISNCFACSAIVAPAVRQASRSSTSEAVSRVCFCRTCLVWIVVWS
jgi:hypothetical protein